MSRHDARLAKLEASIPLPCMLAEETAPGLEFRFDEFKKKLDAEEARFASLTPAGKIRDILAKIAAKTAEAALPAPAPRNDRRVDLGPHFHACLVHEVKQGFHNEYFDIREYEIAILDAAGYDIKTLKSAHARWQHLPWQWLRDDNPLPKEAQSIIDRALAAESSVHT